MSPVPLTLDAQASLCALSNALPKQSVQWAREKRAKVQAHAPFLPRHCHTLGVRNPKPQLGWAHQSRVTHMSLLGGENNGVGPSNNTLVK